MPVFRTELSIVTTKAEKARSVQAFNTLVPDGEKLNNFNNTVGHELGHALNDPHPGNFGAKRSDEGVWELHWQTAAESLTPEEEIVIALGAHNPSLSDLKRARSKLAQIGGNVDVIDSLIIQKKAEREEKPTKKWHQFWD